MPAPRPHPSVQSIHARAYRVPTDAPEADGTLAWDATALIVVEVAGGGETGFGYTYNHPATARVIDDALRELVVGSDPFAARATWGRLRERVRNMGNRGIAASAVSAVDVALWDLAARLLDLPLAVYLGEQRASVPAYGSGGFTSYSNARLEAQLSEWASQGLMAVKMKIGDGPEDDLRRVRDARRALGPRLSLFVDANGAYAPKQALGLAAALAEEGVAWFEEPVSSDDLRGLAFLRDHGPPAMDIAAGEYGWEPHHFRRLLEDRAVDVVQADATRCGGVTGYLIADALCEAFNAPLSAHCAPSLHAVLGCASARTRHIEYFHDHVRIEGLLFDGARHPAADGTLPGATGAPGLGLVFKQSDAERFAA